MTFFGFDIVEKTQNTQEDHLVTLTGPLRVLVTSSPGSTSSTVLMSPGTSVDPLLPKSVFSGLYLRTGRNLPVLFSSRTRNIRLVFLYGESEPHVTYDDVPKLFSLDETECKIFQ